MVITRHAQFKLVEFDRGFTLLHPTDSLGGRKDVAELIIADMPTIATYLIRYAEHRSAGLEIKEAHQRALASAHITSPGVLDLPDDLTVRT